MGGIGLRGRLGDVAGSEREGTRTGGAERPDRRPRRRGGEMRGRRMALADRWAKASCRIGGDRGVGRGRGGRPRDLDRGSGKRVRRGVISSLRRSSNKSLDYALAFV